MSGIASTAPRSVLLVEDDPADAFLVQELLAEVDASLEVTVATSIADVLSGGLLTGADCVLLDLGLPGTQGLDGLHQILRTDGTAAVCVLTGLDNEHVGVEAVGAGAQDYLVKGKVDGPVLIRAVRYAVERRRAESSLLRLREEQLVAAESERLQRGLLPKPLLEGSRVKARSLYQAGRARSLLGGDFFDAVRGPTGTVHAIVGDVCGHGPDEAALGALLRVSWRALVLAGVEEPQLLPGLQQVLVTERHDPTLFTTVCTIAISPAADHAFVRLAGHPPPLAVHPVPRRAAPPVGMPLGVTNSGKWEGLGVTLSPGWALMVYTDGLIEGRGPIEGEPLWEEGLLDMLVEEKDTDLDALPKRLVERARKLNDGPLADDVAILLLTAADDGQRAM